jgi:hypothetical protein
MLRKAREEGRGGGVRMRVNRWREGAKGRDGEWRTTREGVRSFLLPTAFLSFFGGNPEPMRTVFVYFQGVVTHVTQIEQNPKTLLNQYIYALYVVMCGACTCGEMNTCYFQRILPVMCEI